MIKKQKLTYLSEDEQEPGSKIKKLKKKLQECQKEKEEYLTQAQRARADLINYRRRQEEVLKEFKKYSQEGLIRELLPVVDSLLAGSKNEDIKRIKDQLESVLKIKGIKALDEQFNPEFHEAIEQVKSNKPSGSIVEEIQKGYLLHDKVLRPSKVKVSK